MSFESEVAQLRASADTARIEQITQAFPNPDDIEPWHQLNALLWPDLSENENSRREQLPAALGEYQDELRRYIRRYDDLRARRLDALSNYDLGIAYRVSGPEAGLADALRAVSHHIGRCRAQILWLLGEQVRLTPPQLALF
ncbi:hypothetical protein O0J73_07510 [Stenotrophomonas sp. Sm6012]|uniref:hypothetical protein n=1 Tax=Stenotrophomonas sp. Sm6012 TaxID=3002745 RepID=UPI0027E57011|nr:hypothetical protein [Stenotrophomonas sp. Sm6012]MDQ7280580.1 hypothetical protein [Stenotrophomonas sp. Sm6012]